MLLQHLVNKIEGTVACGLWTEDRTAPFHSLAGEHTLELVGKFLVLAEQIAYLTGTYADVACRHILVGTDMTVELSHKRLTEFHDLIVALAADREV